MAPGIEVWHALLISLRLHTRFQVLPGYIFHWVSADPAIKSNPHLPSHNYLSGGCSDPLVGTEHVQKTNPQGAFNPAEGKLMYPWITCSRKAASGQTERSAQGEFRRGSDSFWLREIRAGFMEEVALHYRLWSWEGRALQMEGQRLVHNVKGR